MVDVYGAVTFTLWVCGCNLKCPFCHNWRLATLDKEYCRELDINKLLSDLERSKLFIDYLHVTGGEPLTQHISIKKLFSTVKSSYDIATSLNTNLTLYGPLENIVKEDLVDHVATDLKTPFPILTGHREPVANALWIQYLKSLKLVTDYEIPLELRIPVARKLFDKGAKYVLEVLKILDKHDNYYIIVQPLLGPPITTPRDLEWCSEYCNPSRNELYEVAEWIRGSGGRKVVVKETIVEGS